VSFGVAPALVLYVWSLSTLKEYGPAWGKLGWAAAFIFAACGALRLARFNTQVAVADKRYFTGLAIPAGAGLAMSYLWAANYLGLSGSSVQFITPVVAIVTGLLMVSRFRYFSFKAAPKSERVPFAWILGVLLILVLLAINPPLVLFAVAFLYALSGPVLTLWGLRQRRGRRGHLPHAEDHPQP
jgi:CDP-diacylglycerol---serine O-phosphatidyltransferase